VLRVAALFSFYKNPGVLFVIFHEVKILLFSIVFSIQVLKMRPSSGQNWFHFFMFPEEEEIN